MKKRIQVIVATHKKYQMPNDSVYLPVQVGAEGKTDLGYQKDNTGKNISQKNANYCELTGLYWAWKNLKASYIGLVHYRRYFTLSKKHFWKEDEKFKRVFNREEMEKMLDETDIILPKKRHYYIESLYSHYVHTHDETPILITFDILRERYPEYVLEFERLKKRRSGHMFNMFIMKKSVLNEYCKWLFDILEELERRVDPSLYNSFQARYVGRISELLLDVYIYTNHLSYKEVRVIDMQFINWWVKGTSFLKAKFLGEKYGKSF